MAHKLPYFLSKAAAQVEEFLAALDARQDLIVLGAAYDAEVKEAVCSYAWVRELHRVSNCSLVP